MVAPLRVVSLVPSLTELIYWLGRGDWLTGRTRFCTEPAAQVGRVPIVGGTKNPNVERITGLRPDLVIANREENRRDDVEALEAAGLRVLLTDPNTVTEAVAMVRTLGDVLDARGRAERLASDTEAACSEGAAGHQPRVFVAVWREPWMGLGSETYGGDVLSCAGGRNVLAGQPRYPDVTLAAVAALRPDLLLLPDEPYPFKPVHLAEVARIAPARVIDGKLLWWYGPRMPAAIRQLRRMLREPGQPPEVQG